MNHPTVIDEYVKPTPPPGRPKTVTVEHKEQVINSITRDRADREQSCDYIAFQNGLSKSAVHRLVKEAKYSKVKPTIKPGLTQLQKCFWDAPP